MKRYIKPNLDIYEVKNQEILADSTAILDMDSTPISGNVDAKAGMIEMPELDEVVDQ